MKITRVRIQNYRSIKHLEFQVGDLCALIGPNNSGKSNVIGALALVLGETWPSVRSIEPADFYAYSEEDIVITVWFDEAREIRGDVGDPVEYKGIQLRIDRYKRKAGKKEAGDLRSSFVCVDVEGAPVEILRRPNPNAKPYPIPANVTTEIREDLPAVVIDVDRNARYHFSGSSRSIFGRLLLELAKELKKDTARYDAFKAKFDEARGILRTDSFARLEETIAAQLRQHTGLHELTLQLDGLDPINIYKNFSILFRDPETPELVDFERMGSGVQSALVMSLLQAYRELKKENALVLFEEPELFLHPHGRRHLFHLLRQLSASGVQIIYTTHSQDFVDLETLESVRLVYKTKSEGTKVSQPDLTKVHGEWKERVKHISEPKNEAFFARRVIIVEGPTERFAIRRLSSWMNPPLDLDLHDCSVISADSKTAIPILIRIMAALGKPVFVLYDTDSNKIDPKDINTNKEREKDIEEAIHTHGHVHAWKCDPCFEMLAGMPDCPKSDKVDGMMKHLDALGTWDKLPAELQKLMSRIYEFATSSNVNENA
jgi:putative ATP-dependent endonuclease of OLD family